VSTHEIEVAIAQGEAVRFTRGQHSVDPVDVADSMLTDRLDRTTYLAAGEPYCT
jgi:hypothetical protein